MNSRISSFASARSLLALLMAFAVALLPSFSSLAQSGETSGATEFSVTATATENGVQLEWHTRFEPDNLGFNVYRIVDAERIQLNREIIPGSVFTNEKLASRAGVSFSWLDATGVSGASYEIESINLQVHPRSRATVNATGKTNPRRTLGISGAGSNFNGTFEKSYPAAVAPQVSAGSLETQWDVAGQTGLKIAIKKEGWYRITQPQMAAAGFNPPDIGNLQLFENGHEVGIAVSQSRGTLRPSDYIEFYGRGLDVPTSDTRRYYLIAGDTLGKRAVSGNLRTTSATPVPVATIAVTPSAPIPGLSFPPRQIMFNWIWTWLSNQWAVSSGQEAESSGQAAMGSEQETRGSFSSKPGTRNSISGNSKLKRASKKKRLKLRNYHHAQNFPAAAPANFEYTVERKDRQTYFANLLNGDVENYFGKVVTFNTHPACTTVPMPSSCQVINLPNLDSNAAGPARLEFALQGVPLANGLSHQVTVQFNDVTVGVFPFGINARLVQTVDLPVSQLQNGANTIKFTSAVAGDLSLVDFVRVTYPHRFNADNDSLRFSLPGRQSVKVGGFTNGSVRLIDYTDPFAVKIFNPEVESTGGEFVITVPVAPARSKANRLLLAVADSQILQPAALTINQPSTLHRSTNAADYLIITHKNFMSNVAPLAQYHQNRGRLVLIVDVDDVYDEFGYGLHGPYAVRDFLERAATAWTTQPGYVVFVGDASLDPRNYTNHPLGSLDFVPTKLVDATYNETASDDWLADFDDNGIANIPVGRLPVRSIPEANLIVSKIVNFAPANVPQAALLVADDPTGYYYNFETASDQVQTLLPFAAGDVTKIYRRTQPSDSQARDNIIAAFNQGRALVNYSGHGNVDVWTGGAIFRASDAMALINGNKLSFVVVMDCLNGYYHDPNLQGLAEALLKSPNGGAVASFASSGLTIPDGQHEMSTQLYTLLYGATPIALGDAIKIAKGATTDIDVRRTWIYFGDPALKIR